VFGGNGNGFETGSSFCRRAFFEAGKGEGVFGGWYVVVFFTHIKRYALCSFLFVVFLVQAFVVLCVPSFVAIVIRTRRTRRRPKDTKDFLTGKITGI
jgi:hypothetical protein